MLGAVGLTALAATGAGALAQTRRPVEPDTGRADPQGKFKDKVVLITGATSGIGEGTAYAFAREGGRVFFCGRRENLGRQVEAKIKSFGGEATYQRADVRREEDVKNLIEGCVRKYGRIDVAFNNAGVEAVAADLAEQTLENFINVMQTNAFGVFLSMKYEIPVMLRQGGGVIVNNASVSAHDGYALISPYSASKHAIRGLTKCAALEYVPRNIRINSISPGAVDTPMLRRALTGFKTTAEEVAKTIPVRRISTVEEMARAVMFLSSDDASSVAGMDLDVTGGMLTA
ncbi:MAG: glucose 1-dehydrogenase [Acidobacteria bacterium]|nr:glucose 1-dehydrogenase [Acidobacteriota bacterium]